MERLLVEITKNDQAGWFSRHRGRRRIVESKSEVDSFLGLNDVDKQDHHLRILLGVIRARFGVNPRAWRSAG